MGPSSWVTSFCKSSHHNSSIIRILRASNHIDDPTRCLMSFLACLVKKLYNLPPVALMRTKRKHHSLTIHAFPGYRVLPFLYPSFSKEKTKEKSKRKKKQKKS